MNSHNNQNTHKYFPWGTLTGENPSRRWGYSALFSLVSKMCKYEEIGVYVVM